LDLYSKMIMKNLSAKKTENKNDSSLSDDEYNFDANINDNINFLKSTSKKNVNLNDNLNNNKKIAASSNNSKEFYENLFDKEKYMEKKTSKSNE